MMAVVVVNDDDEDEDEDVEEAACDSVSPGPGDGDGRRGREDQRPHAGHRAGAAGRQRLRLGQDPHHPALHLPQER